MHVLIIMAIVGVLTVGTLDLKDGSFDLPSGKLSAPYAPISSYLKKKPLPFRVMAPSYIPNGFKFMSDDSLKLLVGTNIGIPQVNFLFETDNSKDGIAVRQMELERYKRDVLTKLYNTTDFPSFFQNEMNLLLRAKNGREIYLKVWPDQKRDIMGEWNYMATGYMLTSDSVLQVNYLGTKVFSEEELIKIFLSFKSI